MGPTRRSYLAALSSATLAGTVTGCLESLGDVGASPTPTLRENCEPTPPPDPETGDGLPDARTYPEGPPTLEEDAVATFLERYEAAYTYNAMLSEFASRGRCVKYLERYVVPKETTVEPAARGYEGSVTTRGSYTLRDCASNAPTETPVHADLPNSAAEYAITERSLVRAGTIVACW